MQLILTKKWTLYSSSRYFINISFPSHAIARVEVIRYCPSAERIRIDVGNKLFIARTNWSASIALGIVDMNDLTVGMHPESIRPDPLTGMYWPLSSSSRLYSVLLECYSHSLALEIQHRACHHIES